MEIPDIGDDDARRPRHPARLGDRPRTRVPSPSGPAPWCRPAVRRARSAASRWTRRGTSARGPTGTADAHDVAALARRSRAASVLGSGELEIEGRLSDASNTTLRCLVTAPDGRTARCVYKPVAGERPLWDFPDRTLTRRELAAFEVSEALGWHLVPPTVWREDGPGGAGMCQLWIDEDERAARGRRRATRARARRLAAGARRRGRRRTPGRPRALQRRRARPAWRSFDAVVNNADRKGGHVLTRRAGRVWGIDHGVTFSVEDKLRTVLWGWAGERDPRRRPGRRRRAARHPGRRVRPGRPLAGRRGARGAARTGCAPCCAPPGSRSRRAAGRRSRGRSSDPARVARLTP